MCLLQPLVSERDSLLAGFAKNDENSSSAAKTEENVSAASAEHDPYKSTDFGNGQQDAPAPNQSLNNICEPEIVCSDNLSGSEVDSLQNEGTKKSKTDIQSVSMENKNYTRIGYCVLYRQIVSSWIF